MPVLRGIADQAADGCLVKPLFYTWVMQASPERLNLLVQRPVQREPDGWFHASQHPLATEDDLVAWMSGAAPDDPMGYVSLMSVMFGSLGHAISASFLAWMGASVPLPPGNCPACGRPRRQAHARPDPARYCTEHGFADLATRSRCHLDDILDLGGGTLHGYDFKTIKPFAFKGVKDMDEAAFRAKWPRYWAQMQDCMRLSGLRQYIVFFLEMGNPWTTREFHFAFDPGFAVQTTEKYLRALSRAGRQEATA